LQLAQFEELQEAQPLLLDDELAISPADDFDAKPKTENFFSILGPLQVGQLLAISPTFSKASNFSRQSMQKNS